MTRDIDTIISAIRTAHPAIRIEQYRPTHPADDDGLWFFQLGAIEVQLESSTGSVPFLIESDAHDRRLTADTTGEALRLLTLELTGA